MALCKCEMHIDDETAKMHISIAVFRNLNDYFIFKRKPKQHHDLKFLQSILFKENENI